MPQSNNSRIKKYIMSRLNFKKFHLILENNTFVKLKFLAYGN